MWTLRVSTQNSERCWTAEGRTSNQHQFFQPVDGDDIHISNPATLQTAARLLGVTDTDLTAALTTRVIAARGDVMHKAHNVTQAENGRDALAKAIYERLFDWIVGRINKSIEVPRCVGGGIRGSVGGIVDANGTGTAGRTQRRNRLNNVLGVLDIYGFEIFERNSFEQFCINYCNEKLQQLFIELVLKQEQEEYNREGIEWTHVQYFNNQIICELVEQPHRGIIALLEEACLTVGKMTDEMLLEVMDGKLGGHAHYSSRQLQAKDKELKHKEHFRITHYAGDVVYSIYGFMEKNKDTLFQDFKRLLYNSGDANLRQMWPEGAVAITKTTKRPKTAATLFKQSMVELVGTLQQMEPFYVRCIKPNDVKSPTLFDAERVDHQIRYLGLLENVRVRRAGFVHRKRYDRFLLRYKMISHYTWPNFKAGTEKDGVRVLLTERGLVGDVKFGQTKVFVRSPRTLLALEAARNDMIPHIVTLLQKQVRGWRCRQQYKRMKAALVIVRYYR